MTRWRSIWLVARREILERGRSRGFILSVAFTTLIVDRLVRHPGAPLRGRGQRRRSASSSPRRPALPSPSTATAGQFDRTVEITPYPDARPRPTPRSRTDGRGRRRGAGRPVRRRASPLPGGDRPGDRAVHLGGDHRAARPGRARPSDVDQAALAAAQQPPAVAVARAADRGRPGALPRRQHRRRADPRRHLQLRLHGAHRRRRGEAEPGRGGRALHRAAARPADGQGPRHRHPRLVQLAVFVIAALSRRCDATAALPTTTPAAIVLLVVWFILGYLLYSTALGFLGALPRGWRRPRTRRRRSRWSR